MFLEGSIINLVVAAAFGSTSNNSIRVGCDCVAHGDSNNNIEEPATSSSRVARGDSSRFGNIGEVGSEQNDSSRFGAQCSSAYKQSLNFVHSY